MIRRCRKQNRFPNPALSAGLLFNALFLTLRALLPEPYPGGPGEFFLGALAGLAIALMLLGLALRDPRRVRALRALKRAHLSIFFRR